MAQGLSILGQKQIDKMDPGLNKLSAALDALVLDKKSLHPILPILIPKVTIKEK